MSKHEKFILEDLPKAAVVNSTTQNEESEADKIINEVVTDHLSKIVDESGVAGASLDLGLNNEGQANILKEDSKIDVESIKQEYHLKGYNEAKLHYETEIENLKPNKNLSDLLKQKLDSIVPATEIDSQISIVSADAITAIAKKLHLILPADFHEIIRRGLLEKLEAFYKEGVITITINPERYELCKEILQSDEIPSKFKDNFEIVQDGKLNKDDCSLEWLNTRLEYNQEQLLAEIDKIIEQLKSTTSR